MGRPTGAAPAVAILIVGARRAVLARVVGRLVAEAAPDQLDEHVLQGWLGLAEREDVGSDPAERAHDLTESRVIDEREVDLDGLAVVCTVGLVAGRERGTDDAGQAPEGADAALEPIELEPEDGLPLDPPLQLVRGAEGEDPAMVNDRDPVAQLVGLGHVMGGEEDGPTGDRRLPGEDQLADRACGGDVQPECRLIEEEDPRVVEQPAREVHLLALAGRERAHALLALVRHADRVDQLVDPVPAVAGGEAIELAEHPELLADGQDPVARLLAARDHVHDPPDLLGLALDVEAEDVGRTLRREEQRRQDLDEGGLASAVGSEQAEELAGLDLQIDAVEGDDGLRLDLVDAPDPADVDGERLRSGGGWGGGRLGGGRRGHRAPRRAAEGRRSVRQTGSLWEARRRPGVRWQSNMTTRRGSVSRRSRPPRAQPRPGRR